MCRVIDRLRSGIKRVMSIYLEQNSKLFSLPWTRLCPFYATFRGYRFGEIFVLYDDTQYVCMYIIGIVGRIIDVDEWARVSGAIYLVGSWLIALDRV